MVDVDKRSRKWVYIGSAVLVLGALGTIGAVQAQNHFREMRVGMGFRGPMVEMMVDKAMASVDATALQRDEIGTIAKETADEIRLLVERHEDIRARFLELLSSDTIDHAAFETLRVEMLETADQVSAVAVRALIDSAELLAPEQRIQLVELTKAMHDGSGFGPALPRSPLAPEPVR